MNGLARPVYAETDAFFRVKSMANKVLLGDMPFPDFRIESDRYWLEMRNEEQLAVEKWMDKLEKAYLSYKRAKYDRG